MTKLDNMFCCCNTVRETAKPALTPTLASESTPVLRWSMLVPSFYTHPGMELGSWIKVSLRAKWFLLCVGLSQFLPLNTFHFFAHFLLVSSLRYFGLEAGLLEIYGMREREQDIKPKLEIKKEKERRKETFHLSLWYNPDNKSLS